MTASSDNNSLTFDSRFASTKHTFIQKFTRKTNGRLHFICKWRKLCACPYLVFPSCFVQLGGKMLTTASSSKILKAGQPTFKILDAYDLWHSIIMTLIFNLHTWPHCQLVRAFRIDQFINKFPTKTRIICKLQKLIQSWIIFRVVEKPSFLSNWKIDGSHKFFWLFRSKSL